ncbi:MAG TPA: class I SAM-dependent methyltransferase [Gemmatimonadales bacterium]|nr:class I SAM-dependent methyltransferase [Gemmatimonadales bacterium]
MSASARRAAYGLDAPPVVRNLLIAGTTGILVWGAAALGLWSGVLRFTMGAIDLRAGVAPAGLCVGMGCLAMAAWMIWSSRVGKVRERERLLDTLTWRGDERVLDLGCGRGLMLIGAARRLRTGRAIGIDLWRSEDLGGNSPAAARANADVEGVTDRVTLETADMRMLPLPSGSIDVVLSQAAVHNIPDAQGRRQALGEVVRVLRPGGTALLADIRHLDEYARVLREGGLSADVEGCALTRGVLALLTFGALRPGVVRARQPQSSPAVSA